MPGPEPIEVRTVPGMSYLWCHCGRSREQPFCDGSHDNAGYLPVQFVAEKAETVRFCVCKRTKTPPFCDGSHLAPEG